eukprot:NODE_181_length_13917_cov_0.838110.p5 type:complete len:325 gc:universal NODE_181_length_13917_cov_0.838110:4811-5785(+)
MLYNIYAKHHEYDLYSCEPYEHSYKCYAKERWLGESIYDVMCSEFMRFDSKYYKDAILAGKITINEKKVDLDTIVNSNDQIISHTLHREEPFIGDITQVQLFNIVDGKISSDSSDLFLVFKPSNIPVHPTGAYSKNTLLEVVRQKFGIRASPLHRLDRLTSGLMFISKNTKKYSDFFNHYDVQKKYYCLVRGTVDWLAKTVNAPIASYCKKRGLSTINASGKVSQTLFRRIFVDFANNLTLLEATPITGRTHQIRLHCVHIDHPIWNDPIYRNGLPNSNVDLSRSNEVKVEEICLHAYAYILNGEKLKCDVLPNWLLCYKHYLD